MLRVVPDPGVLVSARITGKGAPAELIRRWLTGQLELVVSPQLLNDLAEVLQRPKFRRWLTQAEADSYLSFLREHAARVADPEAESGHTPDPDDDYLVTLARAAHVDVLVSGDSDLVDLDDPVPPVATPRAVIDLLDKAEPD